MELHHLAQAWLATCRAVGAQDDVADVGSKVLAAYGAPERRYHDLQHLADVLTHVDELADVATDGEAVRLAAWFHDVVYDPQRADNEDRSALVAARELSRTRVADEVVSEVVRLVQLTATHDPAEDDRNGAVLCDADLAVLGRDPDGYLRYTEAVRAEHAFVPDETFRAGRAAILGDLLSHPRLFRTARAIELWEDRARRNVEAELLRLGHPPRSIR